LALLRQAATRYLLPIGTLGVAIIIGASGMTIAHWPLPLAVMGAALAIALVFATVFVVLHHAEAVASRIGEPYGTLVLTLAVTAIEVSVIVSMMLRGGDNPTLARESVFSTVMIVTTGVVGAGLFLGGLRHHKQDIRREGASAFLSVLIAISVLTLILPNYTLTTGPGTFSALQLGFVAVLSVLLYGSFLFAQMVRHQGDFVEDILSGGPDDQHTPGRNEAIARALLLIVGLLGIVLLTEQIATSIEEQLMRFQVEQTDAIIGAFIASLVLAPEALAAIKAALKNELQRSMNIALGSACATIGLTIPTVAMASLLTGQELMLGLGAGDTTLLLLALSISVVSFGTGRTTVLTGLVHLVVFLAYLLLIVVP
jgi:Ca2+:H+ antiporter